jgi:hypothetical protein
MKRDSTLKIFSRLLFTYNDVAKRTKRDAVSEGIGGVGVLRGILFER